MMSADILVVDAEPNICSALARLLRSERLHVTTAKDAAEAEVASKDKHFAVVLCDNLDVIRSFQEHSPSTVKVLMVSQMAEVPRLIRTSPGLKFQVMLKPWSNFDVVETVNHAVAKHRVAVEGGR